MEYVSWLTRMIRNFSGTGVVSYGRSVSESTLARSNPNQRRLGRVTGHDCGACLVSNGESMGTDDMTQCEVA